MSNINTNVDTGINDANTEVETNPVFEEFLRREREAQEAADGGAGTGATEAASGSAPEGTPESPPEPSASEPGSEAPSEGEPSTAPGAPSTEPPSPTPPTPPLEEEEEPPAPAEAVEPEVQPEPISEPAPPPSWSYGGVDYHQDEVTRMVALDNWARALHEDQRTAIDLLLSGQYRLAPVNEPAQPQSQPQPVQQVIPEEDDDLLDPALKARFDALNTEVSTLRQHSQAQQQQQLASQQHAIIQSLDSGRQVFQTEHELNDQEAMGLVNEIVGLQVLPAYLAAHQGDGAAAMRAALEAHYWAKPENQQRELDRHAEDTKSQEQTQTRTRKVSAITGSGGSTAPRVDAVPADPRAARKEAMVKEIADHLNGNTAN